MRTQDSSRHLSSNRILLVLLHPFLSTCAYHHPVFSFPRRRTLLKSGTRILAHFDDQGSDGEDAITLLKIRQWGLEETSPAPTFPRSFEHVASAAFEAISHSLYEKQRPDPNVASNAMSRSVLDYRPVLSDAGRLGIEIDGISGCWGNGGPGRTEGVALRRFTFLLASKLSRSPWELLEPDDSNRHPSDDRPVAIYFDDLRLALLASRELSSLKRTSVGFDNVRICCLSHDPVPKDMTRKGAKTRRARGRADPRNGIVLMVRPTDVSADGGAGGGLVESLQSLIARTAIEGIPTVMISPRLDSVSGGLDAAGYEQSSSYGGREPVRSSPWLLRDFSPPIFAWVDGSDPDIVLPLFSPRNDVRVGLLHSVMSKGHPWHLFVSARDQWGGKREGEYEFVASTRAASGRPSRDIMKRILTHVMKGRHDSNSQH